MNQNDHIMISERPELKDALMLAAWSGWSDAAESGTRALKHLVRELNAVKFAEIDAEEFYVFTEQRPIVHNTDGGNRILRWPANEFYYWRSDSAASPDIVILIGEEPNLKWRTYTASVSDIATAVGVSTLATIGALLDSVPHTRPAQVLSTTVHNDLGARYSHIKYPRPNYEGPSGMTSATIDAFAKRSIKSVSIWGHAPHYLQASHNPPVTLAIIDAICDLASISIDTESLKTEAKDFLAKIRQALEKKPDVLQYITTLEQRYDEELAASQDPEPAEVIDELDAFLRNRNLDS